MTEEIPIQPRCDGRPTSRQIRVTQYVLEYLRDEWELGTDPPETDVLNEAHFLTQVFAEYDHWDMEDETSD